MATAATDSKAPAEADPHGPSVAYLWTADDVENSRLDVQHHMLTDCAWNGKPYLGPVEDVLLPPSEGKAILDLGTGSGIWAIDMALRFPHAQVLGVDLAPKLRPTPPNCRLEVYDINSGLSHWNGQFDIVHTRLISSGIRDYPKMISDIIAVLRPGGLIELSEWDFRVYDREHVPMDVVPQGEPGHSYMAEWLWTLRAAGAARGGHMDAAGHMERWVRECGAFEDVGYRDTWISVTAPTGDTPEEKHYNEQLYVRMKEDAKFFAAAARPALLQRMGEEKLDGLMKGLADELETSTRTSYARMQAVWGRKKA